jgi:pectate lyase
MRYCCVLFVALLLVSSMIGPVALAAPNDLGQETLQPNNGWGSIGTGTTGGAAATRTHIYRVEDRRGLVAALGDGDVPKIIYVDGDIDANVNDDGEPLTCARYATDGFTLAGYVQAFDPATWGTSNPPSGPLEDARRASQRKQASRVQIPVGSNTTIVGVGDSAFMLGVNLVLGAGVDNVIIRNLNFSDAGDCFPQWDPTDGPQGNWKGQYDNITLAGATHVWIDHNDFDNGRHSDAKPPVYLGRPFQIHGGALNITRGSDLVTVSWNHFGNYDKSMLIGATDDPTLDDGKLRVSLHHNLFAGIAHRGPLVRWGQVHVFNNVYDIVNPTTFGYIWGIGVNSKMYAENNVFVGRDLHPEQLIRPFNGSALYVGPTLLGPPNDLRPIDLLGTYNAAQTTPLATSVGWTPTSSLVTRMDAPNQALVDLLRNEGGPISSR